VRQQCLRYVEVGGRAELSRNDKYNSGKGTNSQRCLQVQGSGFRAQGSRFRVQGSGFKVQGSGFRVQGSGFKVQGSRFRVQGSGSGSRFRFRVQALLPSRLVVKWGKVVLELKPAGIRGVEPNRPCGLHPVVQCSLVARHGYLGGRGLRGVMWGVGAIEAWDLLATGGAGN
jgi:hypothetical protein